MEVNNEKKLLDTKDIIEFCNFLKKYSQPTPQNILIKSNNFILCGKRDLRAARILYEKKMYPEYAYHLQQSIEKITKAYVISLNILPEKEIYKINHSTPKAFIKILQKEIIIFEILNKIGCRLNKNFTDINKIIDSQTDKIALYKKKEIDELLNEYEKIIGKINFNILELNKKSINDIKKTSSHILELTNFDKLNKIFYKRKLKKFFNNKSVQRKIMNKKFKQTTEEMIRNLSGLYLLSIITYPHEAYTRYPDKKITPFNYKNTLGIVQHKERLFKLLKDSIKSVEKENKKNFTASD